VLLIACLQTATEEKTVRNTRAAARCSLFGSPIFLFTTGVEERLLCAGDQNMIRNSVVFAFAAVMFASTAVAQAPMSACPGKQNIVRISEIKPGMMAKFEEAVAAQAAWYKQAGSTDEIILLQVVDTKAHALSTTEALTEHLSTGKSPAHDAGFDAFVALFNASSTIKSTYVTCVK
jgi:hypothetical protein